MKDLFVNYDLALKLKDKRFDGQCLAWFNYKGDFAYMASVGISNSDAEKCLPNGAVSAPLWQQVIDWLREEKKLHFVITETKTKSWYISIRRDGEYEPIGSIIRPSYYSAIQAGIEKALELI